MLLIVTPSNVSRKYAIFCQYLNASSPCELLLTITDGVNVWKLESSVSYRNRPKNRFSNDINDYMNQLHRAFQPSWQSSFQYEILEKDRGLELVVREINEGTTTLTLLYKSELFVLETSEGNNSMMNLLCSINTTMQENISEMKNLERDNERLVKCHHIMNEELSKLQEWKDNLETQRLRQFCQLLNSKKREIQRLQEELKHVHISDKEEDIETDTPTEKKRRKINSTKSMINTYSEKPKSSARVKKTQAKADQASAISLAGNQKATEENEDLADDSSESEMDRFKSQLEEPSKDFIAKPGFLTKQATLEVDGRDIVSVISQQIGPSHTNISKSLESFKPLATESLPVAKPKSQANSISRKSQFFGDDDGEDCMDFL